MFGAQLHSEKEIVGEREVLMNKFPRYRNKLRCSLSSPELSLNYNAPLRVNVRLIRVAAGAAFPLQTMMRKSKTAYVGAS
jgi:hypothetical protein